MTDAPKDEGGGPPHKPAPPTPPASHEGDVADVPVHSARKHSIVSRIVVVTLILLGGVLGMAALAAMRQDPPREDPPQPILRAEGIRVTSGTERTWLRGFGSARSWQKLDFALQVTGRVVSVHPDLEIGEVIPKGDVLLEIDTADYELRRETTLAEIQRLETEMTRLDREEKNDQRRLDVANRALELAQRDVERIRELVSSGGAESQAALDQKELAASSRETEVVALENALALYEARRAQLAAQLRSAQANLETVELDIERCTLRAPFDARIEMKMVEEGQLVMANQAVLMLADDSRLEIPVSLDSREVSRWLDFEASTRDEHWFGQPNPERRVEIRWTERPVELLFPGFVSRVESYDPATRTFQLIVELHNGDGGLDREFPLADGMFCEVAIEGREATDVFAVPREAIDSQGEVLLGNDGHILAQPVRVIHTQDDVAYISEGLKDGDIVLTSRPPRIVDGTKVEVTLAGEEEDLTEREAEISAAMTP